MDERIGLADQGAKNGDQARAREQPELLEKFKEKCELARERVLHFRAEAAPREGSRWAR